MREETLHPEEAVGRALWSQTALHTRRELDPQANSVVVVVVARFLSGDEGTLPEVLRASEQIEQQQTIIVNHCFKYLRRGRIYGVCV